MQPRKPQSQNESVCDAFSQSGVKPGVSQAQAPACDAFSKSSINTVKPGVPQISKVSQPAKKSQAEEHVYTAFPKPFFCTANEKLVDQFTNEIAILDEGEKKQLKLEIAAVAKREGISTVKVVALLKEQSQEKLFVVKQCTAGEANATIAQYDSVIDAYLRNNNIQILTYLFHNSVMSNNPQTVELTFRKLYENGMDLSRSEKFDLAMDLLNAAHGEHAYSKMDQGIKGMVSEYQQAYSRMGMGW